MSTSSFQTTEPFTKSSLNSDQAIIDETERPYLLPIQREKILNFFFFFFTTSN